jgi:hypothetical protein
MSTSSNPYLPIGTIPLNKLVPWDGNVRKTGATEGIDELKASIAAHGILQSLVVRETIRGKYAVVARQRRYLALSSLAKGGSPTESIYQSDTGKCPNSLPSGIVASPLATKELANVVGTDGSIHSESATDPEGSLANLEDWEASMHYTNKTDRCLITIVAEFQLSHGGNILRERHSFTDFHAPPGDPNDPNDFGSELSILGPDLEVFVSVPLKIRTLYKSDGVVLLGWRTVGATGFKLERHGQ